MLCSYIYIILKLFLYYYYCYFINIISIIVNSIIFINSLDNSKTEFVIQKDVCWTTIIIILYIYINQKQL